MKRTLSAAAIIMCSILTLSCGSQKGGRSAASETERIDTGTTTVSETVTAEAVNATVSDTAVPPAVKPTATKSDDDGTGTVEIAVDEQIVGDWAPIKMSQDSVVFGRKGGSATVKCENYPSWWLNDIQLEGSDKFWDADPGTNNEYLTAKAPGISAEIAGGNTVVIKVDPSKKASRWIVHLEYGDAFTSIIVIQK